MSDDSFMSVRVYNDKSQIFTCVEKVKIKGQFCKKKLIMRLSVLPLNNITLSSDNIRFQLGPETKPEIFYRGKLIFIEMMPNGPLLKINDSFIF